MKDYKVFQEIDGKRIFVTVSTNKSAADAVKIANRHFKKDKNTLKADLGRVINGKLYMPGTPGTYPKGKAEDAWVVSRR